MLIYPDRKRRIYGDIDIGCILHHIEKGIKFDSYGYPIHNGIKPMLSPVTQAQRCIDIA